MTLDPYAVIEEVVNIENNVADFIANGPSDGLGGYVRDKYRERCREFANAPLWARLLANAPAGTLGRLCKPYLDGNGWDSPTFAPPFQGGQCPEKYIVTFSFGGANPGDNQGTILVIGPIGGLREEPQGDGTNRVFLRANSGGVFGGQCFNILGPSGPQDIFLGSYTPANGAPAQIDGITPCGADNCGDPPPQLEPGPNPPPNPGPLPGPDPTENPDNPTGPPLIPIPPYDDPIFGPVPIQPPPAVGVPDLPGDPTNGPGDPDAIDDPIPGGPGTPNEDGEVGFGAPPTGRAWVGAFVQVDYPDDAGTVPNTAPANAVFTRTVGNVSLKHGSAYSTAVRLSSEWSAIFRGNDNLVVDGCKVNVLPSFSYRVYPVSVETCPENTCTIAEV